MVQISKKDFEALKANMLDKNELVVSVIYRLAVLDKGIPHVHEGMKARSVDHRPDVQVAHLENKKALIVYSFLDLMEYGETWFCL